MVGNGSCRWEDTNTSAVPSAPDTLPPGRAISRAVPLSHSPLLRQIFSLLTLSLLLFGFLLLAPARADPLPSWVDGPAKQAILSFVTATVTPGDEGYIPPAERIATFDNDGTLWAEQPAYFQLFFAIDRAMEMVTNDPSLKEQHPILEKVMQGDLQALAADGHKGLMEIIGLTHADLTSEAFQASVSTWLQTARHPKTGKRYPEMVYQPMLELLSYLRANDYKTYIVSGGGIDFIRVFSEETYGIPPEQVIGSSLGSKFMLSDDHSDIEKTTESFFVDDKAAKPIAIDRHIGRRPVIAVGNSDGDLQMLQYATRGMPQSLAILVHHTDSKREWAYDKDSPIGHLDNALTEAQDHNWTVVDMAKDWRTVFPYQLEE